MNTKLLARMKELECMDESVKVKHLHRRDWPKDLIKNKILLWQVPKTTGEYLTTLTSRLQPTIILELGTSGGYSALCMLKGCPSAHIHTIEFSEYRYNIAKESFQKSNVEDNITQYNSKIAPVLESWNQELDFVFVDANKPAYLENFIKILPFLKVGGVILFDNILDSLEKTQSLLDYVKTVKGVKSEVIDLDNGLLYVEKLVA